MLIDNFKEFKKIFTEIMNIEKHMCIHYSIHTDGIDDLVKYWDIVVNQDYKLTPTSGPKPKPSEEKKEKSKFRNDNISLMFRKHR